MSDDNTDVLSRLGEILSIDKEEVVQRLEDLDVDTTMEVLDALSRDDQDRVAELMSNGHTEDAESGEEGEIDDLSPLFSKTSGAAKKAPQDHKAEMVEDSGEFMPNLGDDVIVDGKPAVVKVVHGPGGTVGVMIDGEMAMVDKKDVHPPLQEGVLGLTGLPGLQRMQELAGIMPTATAEPVQVQRVGTIDMDSVMNPGPVACAIQTDSSCALDAVMTSLDAAEAALSELKVKDAKDVRARLNALMCKLNESANLGRSRKA